MPDLSVVIPAYNEAARIGLTLERLLGYLEREPYATEVVVVDDGSTDETGSIVQTIARHVGMRLRLISSPENRGKGSAVRIGMLEARGEILLFSDADLATPPSEISKVVGPIARGECDLAFGSRAADPALIEKRQSIVRESLGRTFNVVMRQLTGLPYKDTQCGFKAFRRETAHAVFPVQRIEGFSFDAEILLIARLQGWRLLEVPVRWSHVEGSKVNLYGTPIKMLAELAMLRYNRLRGKYSRPAEAGAEQPSASDEVEPLERLQMH